MACTPLRRPIVDRRARDPRAGATAVIAPSDGTNGDVPRHHRHWFTPLGPETLQYDPSGSRAEERK